MARIGIRIEATEEGTEQRPQYENLPKGVYRLQMEAADVVEKNKGTVDHSIMVKATFEVVEPEEFKGRKLFGNYNLCNKSSEAQRIGNEQFQCFLRSIEFSEFGEDDDTDILLFRTFIASVALGKDSKEKNADGTPVYPAKPEIKTYWYPDVGNAPEPAIDAVQPAALATAPAARPAAANNNHRPAANQNAAPVAAAKPAGARPWGKK